MLGAALPAATDVVITTDAPDTSSGKTASELLQPVGRLIKWLTAQSKKNREKLRQLTLDYT